MPYNSDDAPARSKYVTRPPHANVMTAPDAIELQSLSHEVTTTNRTDCRTEYRRISVEPSRRIDGSSARRCSRRDPCEYPGNFEKQAVSGSLGEQQTARTLRRRGRVHAARRPPTAARGGTQSYFEG